MFLRFLGRGAGFADEHTSAYFVTDYQDLFLLDCPMSSFTKVKKFDLSRYYHFYVAITHPHGDHISGLGIWVQYCFFVLHKKVTILAPSDEVRDDIETLLTIEGNEKDWYYLYTINPAEVYGGIVNIIPILTKHSPQLEGKCFGYCILPDLCIEHNFIYTGDTSTLKPFEKYIEELYNPKVYEIYVDVSVFYGQIHLKLEDALPELVKLTKMRKRGIKVYLMHLDDVEAAEKIIADIPNIEVVTLS